MTVYDFIEKFILFVIPGVTFYLLFCYMTGKRPLTDIMSVIVIFITSALAFLCGNVIILLVDLFPKYNYPIVDVSSMLTGNNTITTSGFVSAMLSTVIICVVAVFVWDKNILFKIANRLRITHRIDNFAVWDYLFDQQPWVIIRDYVTGNVYYGFVARYSDGNEVRELLLEDVHVWSKKDGDYRMEKVYLSRRPSEFSIEIDNYNERKDDDVSGKRESDNKK